MTNRTAIRWALLSATTLFGLGPIAACAADAAPDAAAASTNTNEQTIVVTATRRSTSLQDVPINISAVSSQALQAQHIDDVHNLGAITPGLTIRDTGPSSNGTVIMRGLSANDTSSQGNDYDNALAIYLGETPIYADFKFMDIARVETLLGPQGTLYGEGTLAGAIRYLPNRPNPDKWEGRVNMRMFGESHAHSPGADVDGTVNIPLIAGKLALRSSVGYWNNPGFIDYVGIVNQPGVSNPQPGGQIGGPYTSTAAFPEAPGVIVGADPVTGAAPVGWNVNNATPAQMAANVHTVNGVNFEETFSMRHTLGIFAVDGLRAYLTWAHQTTRTNGDQINSGGVLGTGRYEASKRYIEPEQRTADLYAIEIEADIGHLAQLVSDTAWTKQKTFRQRDNTDLLLDLNYGYEQFPNFTSYNLQNTSRIQFNQEIRLVSKHGGPISWTLGGFYNKMSYASNYHEVVPGFPAFAGVDRPDEWEYASFVRSSNEEKAAFGEATVNFTPKFQITGGLRYFHYKAIINGGSTLPLYAPYPDVPYEGAQGETSKSGAVWKLNTSYKFSRDFLAYFTFSKGYRLGGINDVAPCPPVLDPDKQNLCALPNELIYGPDITYNKEIGIRYSLFGGKLRGALAAYTILWNGPQLATVTVNGAIGITVNGSKAVSKGIEMTFAAKPTDGLTISGNYSYNDAHLTANVPNLIHYGHGGKTSTDALAGGRLPGSAKHSGTLAVDYDVPVGMNRLNFNMSATYNGDVFTRPGNQGFGQKLPAYVTSRGSIGYKFVDQDFEVKLYADNLFNKYAVTGVGNNLSNRIIDNGFASRFYTQSVLTPRRAGIELTKTF
ncbi:TonB-dependent receptor [Novosphingobium sp.]|uniref:TonB-dependent receptor n=1 Tax=Novosphingobium sp. TaxID=1874826 RepID=UPI003340D30E